jgi:hypothetical protein
MSSVSEEPKTAGREHVQIVVLPGAQALRAQRPDPSARVHAYLVTAR